jgi:hypothetical protein
MVMCGRVEGDRANGGSWGGNSIKKNGFMGVELRNEWTGLSRHEHPPAEELPCVWLCRRSFGHSCWESVKPKGPKECAARDG